MNGKDTIKCRPYLISDDLNDFPMLDVCLICVKGYDLKNVLENLKLCTNEKTEIVALLNGIDIPDRIHSVIPKALVYPSCVYVATHIKSPGVVQQNGGDAKIITGQASSNKSEGGDIILLHRLRRHRRRFVCSSYHIRRENRRAMAVEFNHTD